MKPRLGERGAVATQGKPRSQAPLSGAALPAVAVQEGELHEAAPTEAGLQGAREREAGRQQTGGPESVGLEPGAPRIGPLETAPSEERQLLADLFHALSQPLTALRCSLELALEPRRTAEQRREGVQTALEYAERVADLCAGIRAFVEADDAGDHPQALALGHCLREAVGDLRPLAEEQGGSLVLLPGVEQGWVRFERQRLRQGLFSLLQYVLNGSEAGAHIEIATSEQEGEARMTLTVAHHPLPERWKVAPRAPAGRQNELERRLALAVARRLFKSAGGSLRARNDGQGPALELRLPLVALEATGKSESRRKDEG